LIGGQQARVIVVRDTPEPELCAVDACLGTDRSFADKSRHSQSSRAGCVSAYLMIFVVWQSTEGQRRQMASVG
jgi:hypothetical protein